MKRRAGTALLALGIASALPFEVHVRAAAAPSPLASAPSLASLALPYSPYLFDIAVYAARSVAKITYTSRRFDPVTRSLAVTGLTVSRDDLIARIGQLRISADRAVLEDIAVDTRRLPLDPTSRALLRRLDRETLTGSLTVSTVVDPAASDYDFDAEIRVDGAGTLDVVADLAGLHILVPLESFGLKSAAAIAGRLRSARIDVTDDGLVAGLFDVIGVRQGLDPGQARATAMLMAGVGLASFVGSLPGRRSPELDERARAWTRAVQAFLEAPARLSLSLGPATPVDLEELSDGVTAQDILSLSPSVLSGTAPRIALVDPARLDVDADDPVETVLPAAKAFIEGVGVPQDLARGVSLVMPSAAGGNRAAIVLLSRAVALDPGVAIAQDRLHDAYVALLLARADSLSVGEASIETVRGRLSPEEVAAGEDEALERWEATSLGMQQHQRELAAFEDRDWPEIRRLALGYYEGTSMPRNTMRAYGWASIAAAGGDRIAAELRDDLVLAVSEGRIVLPIERAQAATAALWSAIVAQQAVEATAADGVAPTGETSPQKRGDAVRAPTDGTPARGPGRGDAASPAGSSAADGGGGGAVGGTDRAPASDRQGGTSRPSRAGNEAPGGAAPP